MKLHKVIALLCVLAMCAGTLAGCGSGSSSQANSAGGGSSGSKITLTFMTWEATDMATAMTKAMDAFMTANPNITVKNMAAPLTDYDTKLQSMISAGQAPDCFQDGNNSIILHASQGILLDLTSYLGNDSSFAGQFFPGSLDFLKYNGKQYGLAGLINVYGYFFNKDLFNKAGVALPTADWTADDLFNAAEKLKDTSSKTYGLYNQSVDPFAISVFTANDYGTAFTDNPYPVTKVSTDANYVAAINKLNQLISDGAMSPPTYDGSNLLASFDAGTIPLMRYGQWEASTIINDPKAANLNWGFVPNPKGSSPYASVFDMTGWACSGTSKNPDAAYTLCKYIVSDMYKAVLPQFPVAAASYQPANSDFYKVLEQKGHKDVEDGINTMCAAQVKLPVRFIQPWEADAEKAYANWNDMFSGKQDPNSYLPPLVDQINGIIAKAK